jgi:hypothetical protein
LVQAFLKKWWVESDFKGRRRSYATVMGMIKKKMQQTEIMTLYD